MAVALQGEPVHVARHGGIAFPEHGLVAGHEIDRPGHDDPRVGPAAGAESPEVGEGGDFGIGPVLALALPQVVEPLAEEGAGVGVVGGRTAKHLDVARPAQPLVALRAVGGNAQEVVALAPADVAIQLVHVGVAGLEGGVFFQVRTDELAFQRRDFHIARRGDLAVAETEEGVGGMEGFTLFRAPERVVERGTRRAQVVGVEAAAGAVVEAVGRAGVVEHLAKLDAQLRACIPLDGEAHPTRHVLSQVEEGRLARLQAEGFRAPEGAGDVDFPISGAGGFRAFIDRDGLGREAERFAHPHGLSAEGRDFAPEIRVYRRAVPARSVVFGRSPIALAAGVVGLAVINVTHHHRAAEGAGPFGIRHNVLHRAVLVFDVQLGDEAQGGGAIHAVGDGAGPPAVAHLCAKDIVAFAHERSHVVGHVVDFLAVVRPSRLQFVIDLRAIYSHAAAVHEEVEHAQSGSIEFGRLHRAFRGERLAEEGYALFPARGLQGAGLVVGGADAQHLVAFARHDCAVAESLACPLEVLGEGHRALPVGERGHGHIVVAGFLVHRAVVVGTETDEPVGQPPGRIIVGVHELFVDVSPYDCSPHGDFHVVWQTGEVGLGEEASQVGVGVGESAVHLHVAAQERRGLVAHVDAPQVEVVRVVAGEDDARVVAHDEHVEVEVVAQVGDGRVIPGV